MSKKPRTMPYKAILESVIDNVLDSLKESGEIELKERPLITVYTKKSGEWLTDVGCLLGRLEGKDRAETAQLILDNLPWLQEDNTAPCPFSDFKIYPPGFIAFTV